MYQHRYADGRIIESLPIGKVMCVGRNYADHVRELNNAMPTSPVLFMKPKEALCDMHMPLIIPSDLGKCHNELEIALLIGKPLTHCSAQQAIDSICGIGLGLDLTLRDIQQQLKQEGQPWERAKSFDKSCPLSGFVAPDVFVDWQSIDFQLTVNSEVRQQGNTSNMLFPIVDLLCDITRSFSLSPGDVVLTGTPSGVGSLNSGDQIIAQLGDKLSVTTTVID